MLCYNNLTQHMTLSRGPSSCTNKICWYMLEILNVRTIVSPTYYSWLYILLATTSKNTFIGINNLVFAFSFRPPNPSLMSQEHLQMILLDRRHWMSGGH